MALFFIHYIQQKYREGIYVLIKPYSELFIS